MKFPIFLAMVMAIFPTIEVQGNAELGADNRKIWFREKMDEILVDINNQRRRAGETVVSYGNELKNGILNSANLRDLFKTDYNRNAPTQIVGNDLPNDLPYQLEVTLTGSSYTKLARYAGKYTLTNEKKNNRYVWVKKSGGHAIWSINNEGWRIGSISEKDRNTDNTAFKSDGFGNDPTDGQWKFRVRNTLYRSANGIIRRLNNLTPEIERNLLFNGRQNLQLHVANFRTAFQGLVDGTDKVATCIETYNAYGGRRSDGYNCGDEIRQPGTPCGGNGVSNIIAINNQGWFKEQLTNSKNGVQPILKNWISANTLGGQPNSPFGKVQLSTSGSVRGFASGSLNTMDRERPGKDLKAHFYFEGIKAQ